MLRNSLSRWQVGLLALIFALGVGVIALMVWTVADISATVGHNQQSSYITTTLANVQRETLRLQMEVETYLHHPGRALDKVKLRRALLQQQLNVVLPYGTTHPHLASYLASFERTLAQLDALLASLPADSGSSAATLHEEDLAGLLAELEVAAKRLYDYQERAFFQGLSLALHSQQDAQRLLLVLASVIAPFTLALILSLRYSLGNRFKEAYQNLAREMSERQKAEQLEQDRSGVLELVARDQPLSRILAAVVTLVQHQHETQGATVLLRDGEQLAHAAGTPLPDSAMATIGKHLGDWRSHATTAGKPMQEARPGSHDQEDGARVLHAPELPLVVAPITTSIGGAATLGLLVLQNPNPTADVPADIRRLAWRAGQLAGLAMEHRLLTQRLAHQARHDPLTGLPNRPLLEERVQQAIAQARQHQHAFAVLFIDLDRFKWINDTQGHNTGDALLRRVAQRLLRCMQETDTVARLGGDEFVLLAPDIRHAKDAAQLAQKLNRALADDYTIDAATYTLTASIGISFYPHDGTNLESLIRNADHAMYQAKERGKNAYMLASPGLDSELRTRLELESSLRVALDDQQFHLAFQPYYHASTRSMEGFEALLRWQHPTRGPIPPGTFIPLAERAGLIVPIGRWVLREACRQAAMRLQAPTRVAVNVSAVQFLHGDFVDATRLALGESGLQPERLVLELTESVLMEDLAQAEERLRELRALGVKIAIDDFGTGYSSLVYLQRLPIDSLKIDRSFVQEVTSPAEPGRAAATLVETIIRMGHNLGLKVVAEGVETEDQLSFLRAVDCDLVQGYLLARPAPLDEFTLVAEHQGGG